VNSLKGSLENVKALGGKVLLNITPIPDMGSFAVIADPQGAFLSLLKHEK
jgi:predicted enzyme related to lactoylglutathione lyase